MRESASPKELVQPEKSNHPRKSAGKKSTYLPTLDGWRAIAILAVIFHHDSIHSLGILSTHYLYEYGSAGVDVFFAISGILICSRLLDEESIFGRIHLKSFYIRRAFRILPPALLYLGVIALLGVLSILHVSPREVLSSIFFCRNFVQLFAFMHGSLGYFTTHFWSLSLEEQFYLFLPALLVFVPQKFRLPVLGTMAVAILGHRFLSLRSQPWDFIQYHTDVRIDSLLVPAIFAVLAANPTNRARFQKWLRFWPLIFIGIVCLLPFGEGTAWHITLLVWAMPCVILGAILNPDNPFGKALEWSPLRYIGRISYSLYLWQQLFYTEHFAGGFHPLGWPQEWPWRAGATFLCAIASYHLLERPVARLGHKMAPSATPGREDLDSTQGNPASKIPS